jgi:undecaprenyl-diphosphatase
MTILHSIILGIIEGITEFLPISSTGHLILASNLLGIDQTNFQKSFEIIIQLGAIASVIFLYWKTLWNVTTIKKLIVAFIPTGIIGLLFYKIIKTYLMESPTVILWSLLLGGIALIVFELWNKRSANLPAGQNSANLEMTSSSAGITNITYRQSFLIGLCQSIAIIPGISRSASTIVGGLLLGLQRKTIVEFSFLLAVPTMLVASGFDIMKNASSFSGDQFGILAIGFVTAFMVALLAIKFFLKFIQNHTFIPFGIYRVAVAIIFLLIVI